jgi:hypothetical protein
VYDVTKRVFSRDVIYAVIYNVGTQFASLAAANPQQIRETRFAVKFTYSFSPEFGRSATSSKQNSSDAQLE